MKYFYAMYITSKTENNNLVFKVKNKKLPETCRSLYNQIYKERGGASGITEKDLEEIRQSSLN